MSTTRRRGIGIVLGVLLAMLVVLPAKPALADDSYTNWGYTFPFSGTNATWETAGRYKATSTEAFLQIQDIAGISGCYFRLDGSHSSTGPWNTGLTRGGSAYAASYRRGYFLISNYVNENGYSYARLAGRSAGGSGTIWGQWSPDTHERYHTILN